MLWQIVGSNTSTILFVVKPRLLGQTEATTPQSIKSLHVYDDSGRLVKAWETPSNGVPFYNAVYSMNFSPDGNSLASSGGDMMIRVWDVATWKETAALGPLEFVSRRVFFSLDGRGRIVATGGAPPTAAVRVFDLAKK